MMALTKWNEAASRMGARVRELRILMDRRAHLAAELAVDEQQVAVKQSDPKYPGGGNRAARRRAASRGRKS